MRLKYFSLLFVCSILHAATGGLMYDTVTRQTVPTNIILRGSAVTIDGRTGITGVTNGMEFKGGIVVSNLDYVTFVVLPDPQIYTKYATNALNSIFTWTEANRVSERIYGFWSTGDNVDDGYLLPQWTAFTYARSLCNFSNIVEMYAIGNHDYDRWGAPVDPGLRISLNYNTYLGPSIYNTRTWYGGVSEVNKAENLFQRRTIAGFPFVFIQLEFGPRVVESLNWAAGILATYPNDFPIFITHSYLGEEGSRLSDYPASYYLYDSDGPAMWELLFNNTPNGALVICGHDGLRRPASFTRSINKHGKIVNEMFVNFQGFVPWAPTAHAFIRLLKFVPTTQMIHVSTYDVTAATYLGDGDNSFAFKLMDGGTVGTYTDKVNVEAVINPSVGLTRITTNNVPVDQWAILNTNGSLSFRYGADTAPEQNAEVFAVSPSGLLSGSIVTLSSAASPLLTFNFDEGTGAYATDSTSGVVLTNNTPAVAWTNGLIKSGAYKPDTNVFYVDHNALYSGLDSFSIEFWAKTPNPSSLTNAAAVSKHTGNLSGEWSFGFLTGPYRVLFLVINSSDTRVNNYYTTSVMADQQWHHYVGTYDGSFTRIYIDGSLRSSLAQTGRVKSHAASRFVVGGYTPDTTSPNVPRFSGQLDEVKFYHGALTETEVAATYQSSINSAFGFTKLLDVQFKEGTGTTTRDRSDNGYTLTLANPLYPYTWNAGVVDYAFKATSAETNSFILPHNSKISGFDKFTIMGWGKLDADAVGQYCNLATKHNSSTDGEWVLQVYNRNVLRAFVQSQAGVRYIFETNNIVFEDNNWHHFGMTYDLGQMSFYVDGKYFATTNIGLPLVVQSSATSGFEIGQYYGGRTSPSQAWRGAIDNVKLFQGALTASDIYAIYTEETPAFRLVPGTGTTIATNGFDLTLSATVSGGDDVYVNGVNVTHPDFDNTAASGTVTPTTFSVASTNVTLTIGNASATQAGAVTTGTQSFAGDKTFTGVATFSGGVNVEGAGSGALVLYDSDASHSARIQAADTTTGDLNIILPAAPSTGVLLGTASGTNLVVSSVATTGTGNFVRADAPTFSGTVTAPTMAIATATQGDVTLTNSPTYPLTTTWTAHSNTTNYVANLAVPVLHFTMTTNMNFLHATNGTANFTANTMRSSQIILINSSGTNWTNKFPTSWKRYGDFTDATFYVTNGDWCRMAIQFAGPSTDQTNVHVAVVYENN